MSELKSSQGQKKLSGLCYENTVIDRKGRIRKLKPPVPIKPSVLSAKPLIRRDFPGQRQEIQHPNDSLKTQPNLNSRNILELNANETTKVQRESKTSGEVLDNDANRLECTEPVWKERPGAKQTSNPETSKHGVAATTETAVTRNRQEVVTTDQDATRDKQGVVANKLDIITDVDNYKQVLVKSAQLRFKVQKIRKHKIDRIEDGIAAATAAEDVRVDATNGQLPQHTTQEPNRNVYELALEALEDDDDDDDEDDDDDDDEEDGGGPSRRSESPDTLVERILENMGDDGIIVDFDGETAPEKPPRRKLYNREKSFSDEILERFAAEKSPDVAPTFRNFKTDERSTTTSGIKRDDVDDGEAVWIQANESQHVEKERRHSELSSAAAAAVIRLDRYIIDQHPIDDVEPEISDVEQKSPQVEPKINHEEPKPNHVDSKISDAKLKNNEVKPEIDHAEQKHPTSESSFVTSAAVPSDVANQSAVVDAQVFSNLSHVPPVQPSEMTIQLADPRRLSRERSPEEIFEEIVESMRDTEGEYEDPIFPDWPEFFPSPGRTPESKRGLRTGGVPIDYSVENDWLSFFYCNRIKVPGGSAAATPPQRRSSQGNQARMTPSSTSPAADGVGIFMNTSLSASTSWMARPVRDAFQRTSLSKEPTTTSRRSEEQGDASQVQKQPEEVSLKSTTEPADVVLQARERSSSSCSRSEEQVDFTIGSSSGRSSSMLQNNQPDLLLGPTSLLPASSGQSSTETLLDFASDDQTHELNRTEVDPQSADSSRSLLQTTVYRNLKTDSESRATTADPIQHSNTDTIFLPVQNPETVTVTENFPDSIWKPQSLPVEKPKIVTVTATEKSTESISKPISLPVQKPEEILLLNRPPIDATVDENPTEILFAALDAAFARNVAPTEVESSTEKDVDSGDDTDGTLTPTDDASRTILTKSHRDAAVSKQLLKPEPRDTANDTTDSVNVELENEKANEARLEESDGLNRSLEESRQLESQTERTHCNVETAMEEVKRLTGNEIAEPSGITELSTRTESNHNDDSPHIEKSNADIDVDVPEMSGVSEGEKIAPEPSDDVAETETDIQQTVANRHTAEPITVRQPHPPKRVVKVLSDEVTTQTVLLKIAWPSAKQRDRSRDRSEQPFRELQLRRTIRMTEPGGNVPQIGRQITPTVPAPSLTNQPRSSASTSSESLTDQTGKLLNNTAVNSNPVANSNGSENNNDSVHSNDVVNSNGVVSSNDVVNSNGVVSNSPGVLATEPSQPPVSSSMATKPEFLVEYENQEHSHNTEVTSDNATVDVTQTDSVKVLLVPMETVYKVQDLKEIVAAVGRTILNDSRRIPVESNVRVTCEAVQSKSCASVQDRDVTVIKNTILDTYNSTNASPPSIKASANE